MSLETLSLQNAQSEQDPGTYQIKDGNHRSLQTKKLCNDY